MAISKSTRRVDADTSRRIQQLFDKSQVSEEREQAWYQATRHTESGTLSLRFPVYEHIYLLNIYAQKLVDLIQTLSEHSALDDYFLHHQFLIQYVRASISGEVLNSISEIERTEAWLFDALRREEERKLESDDPDEEKP
jgi:hypothetical protein